MTKQKKAYDDLREQEIRNAINDKEKEVCTEPIYLDFGCGIARVTRSFMKKLTIGFQKIEANFTILELENYEAAFYIPAKSIQVYGNNNLRKLRDALTEALGEE